MSFLVSSFYKWAFALCFLFFLSFLGVTLLYKKLEKMKTEYAFTAKHLECLRHFKPSLTSDNISNIKAHVAFLEETISAFPVFKDVPIPKSPIALFIELEQFSKDAKKHLQSCNIELLNECSLGFSDFVSKGNVPKAEDALYIKFQKEALRSLLDAITKAKPKALKGIKRYTIGMEKDKDSFEFKPLIYPSTLYQEPVGAFQIQFIGYTESLRLFLDFAFRSSYWFVLQEFKVKPFTYSKSEKTGIFLEPVLSEFTLIIELFKPKANLAP